MNTRQCAEWADMMRRLTARQQLPTPQPTTRQIAHDKVLRERRSQAQARREYQQAVDDGLFF